MVVPENSEVKRLIADLSLTMREERTLRRLVGLGSPEPRNRFDRFLQSPLRGLRGALLSLIAVISMVAAAYVGWRFVERFGMDPVLFSLLCVSLFEQSVHRKLIRKLYRTLALETPANLGPAADT
jgi:hypothetical protein